MYSNTTKTEKIKQVMRERDAIKIWTVIREIWAHRKETHILLEAWVNHFEGVYGGGGNWVGVRLTL